MPNINREKVMALRRSFAKHNQKNGLINNLNYKKISNSKSSATSEDCSKKLPNEYSYDDGRLYFTQLGKGSIHISNGFPVPQKKETILNPDGTSRKFVKFSFFINGEMDKTEYSCELDRLKEFDYEAPYQLIINPTCTNVKRHFVNIMKKLSHYVEEEQRVYFTKLGWTKTVSGHIYVAGNTLISKDGILDPNSYEVGKSLAQVSVNVDTSCLIRKILPRLLKRLSRYPQAALIFIYSISSILKSLYIDAGVPSWFTMLLVGRTQIGKTSTSKYWSQLLHHLNDKEFCVIGLDSSKAVIHERTEFFRDSVLTLDDLNNSASSETKRKKEYTLGEMVHGIANIYDHSTMRKANPFGGGLIASAEYILPNESTINRTLLVDLKKPIVEKEIFNKYQSDRSFIPSVYFHFIQWAAERHDQLVEFIKQQLSLTTKNNLSCNKRVNDSASIMIITGEIFNRFCIDQINDSTLVGTAMCQFHKCLVVTCRNQDSVLQKLSKETVEIDFASVLYFLYRSGWLDIGKKSLEKHDFIVKEGCLIVKTERLNSIIHENFIGVKFAPRAISKQFSELGLLDTDNSAQRKSTKKYNQQRAFFINLARLQEHYLENKDSVPEALIRSICSPYKKDFSPSSDISLKWVEPEI